MTKPYEGPHIVPGSKIAIEKDGVLIHDIVDSVRYTPPEAAIWPHLSRWQQLVRRLTPNRYRKPLQPTRPYKPASVEVGTLGDRQQRFEDKVNQTIRTLLKP